MREQDKKPAIVAEVPDELPMEKELRRREEEALVADTNEQPTIAPEPLPKE